eukprot:scaffold1017_cov374-Prasinococcus_capsulatus_cf.AAC.21
MQPYTLRLSNSRQHVQRSSQRLQQWGLCEPAVAFRLTSGSSVQAPIWQESIVGRNLRPQGGRGVRTGRHFRSPEQSKTQELLLTLPQT